MNDLETLRAKLEEWRLFVASRTGLPISDADDNLHWAAVAIGRIDVLEKALRTFASRAAEYRTKYGDHARDWDTVIVSLHECDVAAAALRAFEPENG